MTEKEQLDAAREFAHRVIQAVWNDGDPDGGEIQDWAQELGLIYSRKATQTEAAEWGMDAGDSVFVFEDWMQVPSPPDGLPYR